MNNFKMIAYRNNPGGKVRKSSATRRRRTKRAAARVSESPMVKWDSQTAFINAQVNDPFWFVYFSQADWNEYNLADYFKGQYTPRKLQGIILRWIGRIRKSFSSHPFYVGHVIWNMIKLLPAKSQKAFILSHKTEVGYVINKLFSRETRSVEIPKTGFLDEEASLVGSFTHEELAELIDGFVFHARDVVVYLINNPERREALSNMRNQTLRDIIEFNIALIEAGSNKRRIRGAVVFYGGRNVPGDVRERVESEKRDNIPLLSGSDIISSGENKRRRLYKIAPLLAVAEVVLFDGLIVRTIINLINPREILDLMKVEKGKDGATQIGETRTRLGELFDSRFYYNRWPLIVYLVCMTDPIIFDVPDVLLSSLGKYVARYFSDTELAEMFALSGDNIKAILKDDEKRLEDVMTVREVNKDRKELVKIAQLQRAYERDRVRNIGRIHITLRREIEAEAILLLRDVELKEGQKDQAPDILSVRNACKVLGVSPDDRLDDIRLIYRHLSFMFHPDRAGKGEEIIVKMVSTAWEIIGRYFEFKK